MVNGSSDQTYNETFTLASVLLACQESTSEPPFTKSECSMYVCGSMFICECTFLTVEKFQTKFQTNLLNSMRFWMQFRFKSIHMDYFYNIFMNVLKHHSFGVIDLQ